MKLSSISKGFFAALALALCVNGSPARAQEVVVGPPPDVLATLTPVYYNGAPSYWWGGRWYFRDGYGWHFHHDEPAYLRDWRGHHEFHRAYYGRGGLGGRGGWGGRGGGRGGRR
jgi:hypothetical protein